MDEENQNQTEQQDVQMQQQGELEKFATQQGKKMGRNVANQGLKLLKKAGAHLAKMISGFIMAHIVPIIIIVAIIVGIGILLPAIEDWIDANNAETIDEVTYQMIKEYCSIDEKGIHFDKEGFLKNITVELAKNGIDLDSLGLGEDKTSLSDSNTILGNNIDKDSEAAQYLYKFVTASLAGEFPYIEGSDPETQGIIKIKRKTNSDKDAEGNEKPGKDLEYMGYEEFKEKLANADTDEKKDDMMNYFSLDQNWNLCIVKPYKQTKTYTVNGVLIADQSYSTYTISEVKIPYRTMVAQYTVPFLFLIDLQMVTHNATYVEAVAELMTKQSEIEFTVFDEITTDDYTYTYTATRNKKWWVYPENEYGLEDTTLEPSVGGPSSNPHEEVTHIITQTDKIKANVTKANTWIIKQETKYEMQETIEKSEETNPLEDEQEPDPVGDWDTDRSENIKDKIIKHEWVKSETNTKIHPDKFMGLWSNATGTYVKGATYLPVGEGKPGKVVKYNVRGTSQVDRPIINIVTAREELYDYLANISKTQLHSELMQEMIGIYMRGEELPDGFGVQFEELFDTNEFIETNWNSIGSGFWWPVEGTPSYEKITSYFGPRNIGLAGASTYHKGIDIGIPVGTEIIASADGVVEVSDYSNSAGFYIKINHGNGFKTVYMHNSTLLVNVGQEVKQGDIIAYSGNSGISTGPHLHFGIEVNGEYVNPLDYVSQENRRPIVTLPDVTNVEEWRSYVENAFSELGYTMTQEKVDAVLRQISTESGGNQAIIQGITDSNSGTQIGINGGTCPWCPSSSGRSCGDTNIGHGLLQFIPTTFYSNMVSGHTNIFNGYDQICACITMLERRSGSYSDYIGNGTGWG